MAVIMQQFTVTSATAAIFNIPPGYFYASMYNSAANTAVTAYLGTSPGVSATNGMVMHSVPTSFQGSMTSKGALVYGFATGGTAILNLLMITDQ